MLPGVSDRVAAPRCKPGGAKHGSGSVLQPCLQLAETHQACLLAYMLLAFLASLQAPEDTDDTGGGLISSCIRPGGGGPSAGVFCGWREMGYFPLGSGVLMQLHFHRASGSVFASVSGKKRRKKNHFIFVFPFGSLSLSCHHPCTGSMQQLK